VHLRIPLLLFVLGGAGGGDQGCIDDRALLRRHAYRAKVNIINHKDLRVQIVLLKHMVEGQDRGLIQVPIADQLHSGKAAHGGHLDQCLFHGRIAERIPLLLQADAQHRGFRVGRSAALLARFGVVGLDQCDQFQPGHHHLYLSEKRLPFGLLLGGGEHVIREAKLHTIHYPSHRLQIRRHCPADGLGYPESP